MKSWSRRQVLGTSAGVVAGAAVSSTVASKSEARGGPVVLVRNHEAKAAIVLAAESVELIAAAEAIVEVVRAACDVDLTVATEMPVSGLAIHLGQPAPGHPATDLDETGSQGFAITVTKDAVSILGATEQGTRMGAYALCEEFFDARWLYPEPEGLDVPRSSHLSLPLGRWVEQPSFEQRSLSPFHRRLGYAPENSAEEWALRNRVNWLFDQGHNLWALVPVEKYGDPSLSTYRPDFYPILDGERFIPAVGGKTSWEPRLTADGIVDAAVAEVLDHLRANPGLKTYGIGVNDSGRWSDDEVDSLDRNVLGYPNMSEVYYRFIHEVVSTVSSEFPDVTFGTIAYQHVMEPPSFRLHPQIVVFLCQERYGWVNQDYRETDQDLTLRWLQSTDNLGWYDYYEMSAYQVPRPMSALSQEAYRWAQSVGVRHLYAELYPNFAGGPESLMVPRLLWNVDLNLDAELSDWYRRMVGPAAAGPLRSYFRLWEQFWLETVPQDREWFETARVYFNFTLPSYLRLVTPQLLEQCRALIATVVEMALRSPDARHAERAELIRRGFELVEAAVISYPAQQAEVTTLDHAQATWDRLVDTQRTAVEAADRRRALLTTYDTDPVLKQWNRPLRVGLDWTGWKLPEAFAVSDWILEEGEAAEEFRRQLWDQRESNDDVVATLATVITDAANPDTSRQLFRFSDMEDERWTNEAWRTTVRDQPLGETGQTTEVAHSGTHSFGFPANSFTLCFRSVIVQPGPIRIRLKIRGTAGEKPAFPASGWQVQLWNTVYRESGNETRRSAPLLPQDLGEDWVSLEWSEVLPDDIKHVLTRAMVITTVPVYIDDYEVWQYG